MKKRYNYMILGAFIAALPSAATAQDELDGAADSIADQKVHVAFREVDQSDLMGGVSFVDMENLFEKRYSTYSLTDMMSVTTSDLWDMGGGITLVDGVERPANDITPSEISQVTYLKGAQAVVLYGSRAAKGAILITTKRGKGDGLHIRVSGNAGLYVPKRYPKYLAGAEYMTLYNEARANDGLEAAFTEEQIYHTSARTNPYRYPSLDFFSDDYIKKHYERYEGTAEFYGGGKFAKFYANVGLYNTSDLMNFGEGKKNRTTRLNVRGNIDLTMNDWIGGWINTSATFYDGRGDHSNYWASSASMRPTTPGTSPFSPLIPIDAIDPNDEASMALVNSARYLIDGKYLIGGTQLNQTNPFAAMYAAGYNKYTSRHLNFDAGIKIGLDRLVPGLKFQTKVAVDYATSYNTSINNSYAVYEAQWYTYNGQDYIGGLTKYGTDKRTGTQNVSDSYEEQTIMWAAQFDYARTFAGKHNVDAMLVANGYQITYTGKYHRNNNANLALHAAYNYDRKYYAEFNGALVHSSKLAPGHRLGFSPVGTLGWRISQEDFLKDSSWLNELKIDVTYGRIKEDIDLVVDANDIDKNYYMYQGNYDPQGPWWGWNEVANSRQTFVSLRGANEDLDFVTREEFNVGLNLGLFNDRIRVNANYYNIVIDGLPMEANTLYPNYFKTYWPTGSFVPYFNYNKQRHRGFDVALKLSERFGDFSASLGVNVAYHKSKNLKISEIVEHEWQRAEGQSISALRGYQCLGFFQTEEEIANSACVDRANTKPGDLKYKDMNNDGIIDGKDQVVLGDWSAPWAMGANLTLGYKGFTLYVAGSGNFGGQGFMDNDYMKAYGDRKYSEIARNRWTPETAKTATYPRLTSLDNGMNFNGSDFWIYDTDVFYLNTVQLTYTLPASLFKDKFVKGLQVYVQGNDLATISKHAKYMETNIGSAPQCRNYNLGVKVNF